MAYYPNLTQFFGSKPLPPPDGTVDTGDDSLDFSIPSAYENPDLWDNATFQSAKNTNEEPWKIAPDGMIVISFKVNPKVKLDNKGGAGKKTPRTTKAGGDVTKVTMKIRAVEEAWPYVLAAAGKLQVGEEFNISHPTLTIAKIGKVVLGEWKNAPAWAEKTHEIEWEIDGQEVKPQAQTGAGGGSAATTPDSANSQRANYATTPLTNFPALPLRNNPNTSSQVAAQTAATQP